MSDAPTGNSDPKSGATESRPPETPAATQDNARPKEYGGRNGPDPTRYGDWEKNGRCIDF